MAKAAAKPKEDDKKPGATEGVASADQGGAAAAPAPAPVAPIAAAPTAAPSKKEAAKTQARELSQAATDVLAERARQVEAEGYAVEADDTLTDYQLPRAAACYVLAASGVARHKAMLFWPFAAPMKVAEARRRNLVKAGALILAELERLDREAEQG